MEAQFRFTNLHLYKPQNIWKHTIWTDETKMKMVGYHAEQQTYLGKVTKKYLVPIVKLDSGEKMIWSCFAAMGMGNIWTTMNSTLYENILEKK